MPFNRSFKTGSPPYLPLDGGDVAGGDREGDIKMPLKPKNRQRRFLQWARRVPVLSLDVLPLSGA